MGGYGSGRLGYKQKIEDCRSLNVNRMRREGCLLTGNRGNWVWSRDGEETARISYSSTGRVLLLEYRVREWGGDWQSVEEPVRLEESACTLGGSRTYFRCPGVVRGVHCNRRVAKLYLAGKYFLCRHCHNLAYSSQSQEMHDRLHRRANKLRMELGGEPGMANMIAFKPKGMWQATYDRKIREIDRCEYQANRLFLSRFRHMLSLSDIALLEDLE